MLVICLGILLKQDEIDKIITNMSLKSYLSPIVAFEKWLLNNPKGGIFEWNGQKFKVEKR